MTDQELDMITGGNGTAFILPGKTDGTYIVIQCKAIGDIDKMKHLLQDDSIDSIEFTGSYSKMTISGSKLDNYISRLQSRDIDIIKAY